MTGRVPLEEVADRMAISDLCAAYAEAVDAKDFDAVRSLFVPEATVDFTSAGGPESGVEEFVGWLRSLIASFPTTLHLVTNERITISGDEATSTVYLINPMVRAEGGVMQAGGSYRDRFVRTPDGWRFAHRTFRMAYLQS